MLFFIGAVFLLPGLVRVFCALRSLICVLLRSMTELLLAGCVYKLYSAGSVCSTEPDGDLLGLVVFC